MSRAAEQRYEFKRANRGEEYEQIYALNYRTFVEEIPQHPANELRRLVDKFDAENVYFVCKARSRVVGMLALRLSRPFSLDAKLQHLDSYLPKGLRFAEIRLLAVEKEFRNGVVFRGLLRELTRYCVECGVNGAVISGTTRQLKLYRHLGFVPFGPLVGGEDAQFQPMYATLDMYRGAVREVVEIGSDEPLHRFLPGPVDVHADVLAAYRSPPRSHREAAYQAEMQRTLEMLRQLTGARNVAVTVGSGTLANDIVAAQLSAIGGKGIVLANGEFGERLVDHASRAGLDFEVERVPEGLAFTATELSGVAARRPYARWWWLVHHETSTGVLNDIDAARAICRRERVLCADCVSSVGLVPVDLRGVRFASGVSGKGLGAIAGLAMVFYESPEPAARRLPRYFDLTMYESSGSVPFTQPSALLSALRVAVERALVRPSAELRELDAMLRTGLSDLGLVAIAEPAVACPGLVTLAMESPQTAVRLGDALARRGLAISYRSAYLMQRGWVQIALMGDCTPAKVRRLLRALRALRASAA